MLRTPLARAADYVIVGAGSAGCVLANRLSAGGKHSVLLIEAGGTQALSRLRWQGIISRLPTALAMPMHDAAYNWGYVAEAEASLEGRVVSCPRGKGIGGSSAINGMVYVRGHPHDFDSWAQEMGGRTEKGVAASGEPLWDAAHCLPYFRKMENVCAAGAASDEADVLPGRRGRDGPLHVSHGRNALGSPLYETFIKAGQEAGYGSLGDYNGCRQEGLSPMPMTVFHSGPRAGERCSTAAAYLEHALDEAGATRRLELPGRERAAGLWGGGNGGDGGDGAAARRRREAAAPPPPPPPPTPADRRRRRCVGADGSLFEVHAEKEVIVAAGAIASPQLLQLSGVGRQARRARRPAVCRSPASAPTCRTTWRSITSSRSRSPSRCSRTSTSCARARSARGGCSGDGLGATNHFEAGGFVRSRPGVAWPGVQLHFLPVALSYDGTTVAETRTGHSLQMHVGYNRSPSRGFVRASAPLPPVTSNGAGDLMTAPPPPPPVVRFNYMSDEEDWRGFRAAVRIAREIVAQPAFDGLIGDEITPVGAITDADLDAYLVEHLESAYHPCGTCKMGSAADGRAVVDGACRVHGVDGLRVVDASIFPTVPNGNLNAPTIMAAEKAADLILGTPLPPDAAAASATWIDPEWRTRQREREPMRATWDRRF